MIIRPKDAVKLLGVLIMTACAVFVCTLFLNNNIDMTRIKDQIADPEIMVFYDTLVLSGKATSAVSGGALMLTTVVMLIFYIKHYIDTHKSELGILKALGYSNSKIAKSFWVFGSSVFAGTAIGFCCAFIMMPAFYRQNRSEGLLPDIPLHFNPALVFFLVILPSLAFALLAILYSNRKLKCPALELITGKNEGKHREKKQEIRQKKELPFLHDLKHSTVRSRKSLVFLIAFSSFCYSSMTQLSFSMRELSSEMFAIMIIGIGFVLAFTTLFIAATTVVRANAKTIAMLRVFGYSDRECGKAILHGYRPTAYIGFAVGTAYQYGLLKVMVSLFFAQSVVDIPEYHFDVKALVVALVTFVLIYEAVMYVYTARIKRISLKEVMQEG
jgi:putative ABC transport system permease protein